MVATQPLRALSVDCSDVYLEARRGGGFALRGLTLALEGGALRTLLGPGGAGKTALLRLLAGLDRPRSGRALVDGLDLRLASAAELRELRRGSVGLVTGVARHLLPRRGVAASIELPLRLAGVPAGRARRRARELIELVGLDDLADVRAGRLPPLGAVRLMLGQALSHDPELLLLDEPAATLSEDEREELLDILGRVHAGLGPTVLLATRDARLAHRIGGVVRIQAGRVVSELVHQSAFSRGEGERTEELAVVDHDGRITIPPEQREALGIGRRARISIEDDHVGVWPERPPPDTRPPWRRR